jgi:glycine C-acetyltransferase
MANDIFDKIDRAMNTSLGSYASFGHGWSTFPKLEGEIGPNMTFKGEPVLVWSLNDYLGLANHPEVRAVDAEAAARWGFAAPMGARMLTGQTKYHEQFERNAAAYVQKEDAFLLNFGYQGCMSIVQALADRRDVIVYDQLCHACIIDGMNLSPAKRFMFAHNDMEQFEDRLKKAERVTKETGGGILVITEGVFGMKGDLGNLAEIVKFKDKYKFRIFIDDAHGFGVMGANGRGVAEHFGVEDQIDVTFYTFAKSMAMIGAFVASSRSVVQYMRYHMRSQIYAKALPLALTEGAIKRLDMVQNGNHLRKQCWDITHAIQAGLRAQGLEIGPTESPVTPVYLKLRGESVAEAIHVMKDLRENHGIFVSGVTYPVTAKGELILRIIPTASHTMDQVTRTLKAFSTVAGTLTAGAYSEEIPVLIAS